MAKDKTSLLERIQATTNIKEAAILSESKFFAPKDYVHISVPILNVAFSGFFAGGLTPGLTMFAGPSKHFKTLFSLICAKAYLDKYPESVMILYDSEFGSPMAYFMALDIDPNRVVHIPVVDIEQLKNDLTQQVDSFEKGDRVVIVVDSVGNIASKKEIEDALNNKSVADMTRAKALKSLFRIVSPRCVMKEIPFIVINHTYKEQSLFPKDIVSGGTGSYYNSDNLFIIGRQQEKDGKELEGYNFTLKVEKSRHVKEGSQFNVKVLFDTGIYKWSGILDLAVEHGLVRKYATKPLKYSIGEDGEQVKEDDLGEEFFNTVMNNVEFQTFVRNKFKLSDDVKLIGE